MKSYPSDKERGIVADAEKLMEETMARYDPSHDAYHVQRVRKTALFIADVVESGESGLAVDRLVVELAALLHDVLDKKYVSTEVAADPYGFFFPYFTRWSELHGIDLISDGRARTIARIVDSVSWTTEKQLRSAGEWSSWHETTLELHCVQDADRLDAIGAFGVMRCAAYSAAVNRPLYAPPNDVNQSESAVQHFHEKLVHIHERLKTAPGRKLGERRHRRILDFLCAVDEEANPSL